MSSKLILGLDGGGTYSRVAVTDTRGNLLSYVEKKGASSLHKDLRAKDNVHDAINQAVEKAGYTLADVAGLAAGVAGFDKDSDLEWVSELTCLDGLECPSRHVNDAVVAQYGAFLSKPGIVVISGTGSIILGKTESGRHIRNYDFQHYAATAARYLSYDAVNKVIAGEFGPTDSEFVNEVLKYFKVIDLGALAKLGSEGYVEDKRIRNKLFGDFAPVITRMALKGSPLPVEICDQAAAAIVTGVRVVGACFYMDPVPVALIGSVANSAYIKNAINEKLHKIAEKSYVMVESALPAVLGAVLVAMELIGIIPNEQVLDNLKKGARLILKQE